MRSLYVHICIFLRVFVLFWGFCLFVCLLCFGFVFVFFVVFFFYLFFSFLTLVGVALFYQIRIIFKQIYLTHQWIINITTQDSSGPRSNGTSKISRAGASSQDAVKYYTHKTSFFRVGYIPFAGDITNGQDMDTRIELSLTQWFVNR